MTAINPVDLNTLGARVTDPAQLTIGRWYAVRTTCGGTHNPLVHAQYMGMAGRSAHEFDVCYDDYAVLNPALGLARQIYREDSNIRTGKINGGRVCEIFKFKQVKSSPVSIPQESPYADEDYATCARYGIKVGDKFEVINADYHTGVAVGDIVTLRTDDGSNCPYFTREATGKVVVICLHRLVPVVANQSNTAAPRKKKAQFNKVGSPYSKESTCRTEGIKEGDLFVVVCPFAAFPVGMRVRLFADDGTHAPMFEVADGSIKRKEWINLSRLQPCPQEEVAALNAAATSPVVISTVDQLKSEIDAIRAQIAQKADQIKELRADSEKLLIVESDLRDKLRDQLQGYI